LKIINSLQIKPILWRLSECLAENQGHFSSNGPFPLITWEILMVESPVLRAEFACEMPIPQTSPKHKRNGTALKGWQGF
jgi:hypothetical protein